MDQSMFMWGVWTVVHEIVDLIVPQAIVRIKWVYEGFDVWTTKHYMLRP